MSNKYNESIKYIKNVNIDKFDASKLNYLKSEFMTENSKDIPKEYIIYAISKINRPKYVIKMNNLLLDMNKAKFIETSIFEYSLIHVTLSNINKMFIEATYNDKFEDIYENLNTKSRFKNNTLITLVMNNMIDPKLIAFLSPDQLHPISYSKILDKIKFKEETENNMAFTDIYKCYKCGERKSKISELQLRCADEPISRFVTCLVCYNTFIK